MVYGVYSVDRTLRFRVQSVASSYNVLFLNGAIVPPYDARAVANFLLDLAERDGKEVSNLVLQKLVYFAHGRHLHVSGLPSQPERY